VEYAVIYFVYDYKFTIYFSLLNHL